MCNETIFRYFQNFCRKYAAGTTDKKWVAFRLITKRSTSFESFAFSWVLNLKIEIKLKNTMYGQLMLHFCWNYLRLPREITNIPDMLFSDFKIIDIWHIGLISKSIWMNCSYCTLKCKVFKNQVKKSKTKVKYFGWPLHPSWTVVSPPLTSEHCIRTSPTLSEELPTCREFPFATSAAGATKREPFLKKGFI